MNEAVKIRQFPVEKPESTVLKALAYFDLFDYPLTREEIRCFAEIELSNEELDAALIRLLFANAITRMDRFFSLRNDHALVQRRINGNQRAQDVLPKALRAGRFLYRFPFVKAVGISGSLSKQFADEKADFDFFIITRRNRLWIARTMLHLFKKLTYLAGRQHQFCMNYFVDEAALLIEEQNLYSAIEIATLIPVAGAPAFDRFFQLNSWIHKWLPAAKMPNDEWSKDREHSMKRRVENAVEMLPADGLDDRLLQLTTDRWKRKERIGARNVKGNRMNLITGKHFSKSDPDSFQSRLMSLYQSRLASTRSRWPQFFE
ncbi:MAG TPA: hypothetical protein VGC95_11380 [Chitinophagaceae bacterium]